MELVVAVMILTFFNLNRKYQLLTPNFLIILSVKKQNMDLKFY